jgi:hypothetical protein
MATAIAIALAGQAHAMERLNKEQIDRLPQDKVLIIKKECASHWGDNFEMRLYCEDKQFVALQQYLQRNGTVNP